MMGILQPDAGEVVLLGRAMARVDTETKRHIGYVSQEPHFYPWMTGAQLGRFVGGFYPTWDHAEFRRLMGRCSCRWTGGFRICRAECR